MWAAPAVLTPPFVLHPITPGRHYGEPRPCCTTRDFIDEKQIAIADAIVVRKAGEIIPKS